MAILAMRRDAYGAARIPGTMKTTRAILSLSLLLGSATFAMQASAQVEMYPGQDVTVNPSAAGTRVLLYPGGQYMRVVPPLMVPGARAYAPIHLHMPRPHKPRVAARPKPAEAESPLAAGETMTPATAAAITPPAPANGAKPKPAEAANTAATPAAAESDDDSSASSPGTAAIPFSLDASAPPPAQPQAAARPSKPKPQTQMASTGAPAADTARPAQRAIAPTPQELATHAGLVKRSEIIFEAGASDPAPSTLGAIKSLAGTLAAAIADGAQRIQLEAYGGARGDKSSDARRLSLKRALSIRQLLIDDGVPAEKIDVRAMGGADDKGPTDRVDVFVRAG